MTTTKMNKLVKIARSLRDVDTMSNLTKSERIKAKREAAIKARDCASNVGWSLGIDTTAIEAEMQAMIVEADADMDWLVESRKVGAAPRKKTGWEAEVAIMIASH